MMLVLTDVSSYGLFQVANLPSNALESLNLPLLGWGVIFMRHSKDKGGALTHCTQTGPDGSTCRQSQLKCGEQVSGPMDGGIANGLLCS